MTIEIKAPEKIKKGGVLEGIVIIALDKDVKFRDVIISLAIPSLTQPLQEEFFRLEHGLNVTTKPG